MVISKMMKLSISKCSLCNKTRLVDRVNDDWICFACKQTKGIHNTKPSEEKISGKEEKIIAG